MRIENTHATFLSNAFLNMVAQIITALVGFVVTTILFKTLETEKFLAFSYLTIGVFFLNYTNFGIPIVVTRAIALSVKSESTPDYSYVRSSFLGNAFCCAGCVLVSTAIYAYISSVSTIFNSSRLFIPLYGVIVFYFISIQIRSVADGLGQYGLSRVTKAYFYISFFIVSLISGIYKFSAVQNLILLLACSVLLVPKILALNDRAITKRDFQKLISLFRNGIPFLALALLSGVIGYADRFMIGMYISGTLLAALLYIFDIASRQSLLGSALANISLKKFIDSDELEASKFLATVRYFVAAYVLISVLVFFILSSQIIEFIGLDDYHKPVIINAWLGFGILVFHAIQWQYIVALSLEKKFVQFLFFEACIFPVVLLIVFNIDATYYMSVALYFRAYIQVVVADVILRRTDWRSFAFQIYLIAVFAAINRYYI